VRRTAFDLGKHDSRDVRKTPRHTIKILLRHKRERREKQKRGDENLNSATVLL